MATGRSGANARDGSPSAKAVNRRIKRARSRLLVRFGTAVPDKMGFTKNVSDTGLFIHTNQVFRPGTTVQLSVKFPDRVFTFWGRVIWAKRVPAQLAHILDCGMGICFVDPSPEWLAFYETWKQKACVL
jgi:hypothetical protein